MSLLVDNPILNSPFEEPARYWAYEEGQPVLKEGRRPAGYYLSRVKQWSQQGYMTRYPITDICQALRGTVRSPSSPASTNGLR
jgi:hypothetical protein